MENEVSNDVDTMTAYRNGFKASMERMEMALTDTIVDIEAQTTLEKAAYLSLYTPLLERLWELSVISEAKYNELSRQLNKNNPQPLCIFDPEVDCHTGEQVQNGRAKLFSWDAE